MAKRELFQPLLIYKGELIYTGVKCEHAQWNTEVMGEYNSRMNHIGIEEAPN